MPSTYRDEAPDRRARRKDPGCHGVWSLEMEPHGLDPASDAALVLRAIEDIDRGSDEDRDALLLDLLYAGWGSPAAQNQ
jgi:hypothetical protein